MVHKKVGRDDEGSAVAPAYTHRLDLEPIPKFKMPLVGARPEVAYRLIHDELLLDGSSRLNMATFVTTWMEPEADRLMAEAFDKNMIDKDEYPQTAEIERRCVNIVADLFNAPDERRRGRRVDDRLERGRDARRARDEVALACTARGRRASRPTGRTWSSAPTSRSCGRSSAATGTSSRATCRWQNGRYVVDPDDVMARVDENTIGVIPILGTTFTGEFEPIKEIHDAVVAHNARTRLGRAAPRRRGERRVRRAVPAPGPRWDFRLPQVKSINVSGHKYGLTYPGVGFVVWRSADDLPEDLVFHVNYLGGDMPTFTLNFSRPGQPDRRPVLQLRAARAARATAGSWRRCATSRSTRRAGSRDGPFELFSDGTAIPVFAFTVKEGAPFTVFDVSDQLRTRGWQVPAYTMPADASEVAVLRIVVREGSASTWPTTCSRISPIRSPTCRSTPRA